MQKTFNADSSSHTEEHSKAVPTRPQGTPPENKSRWQRFLTWWSGGSARGLYEEDERRDKERMQRIDDASKDITCAQDCCLPVYLDEAAVHTVYNELLGPLTLSTQVESTIKSSEALKRALEAEAGINVMAGSAKAGASQETTTSQESGETSTATYSCTYQALFNKVRKTLRERGLLKEFADRPVATCDLERLSEYDFVELSAHVYVNPVVRTLSAITELKELDTGEEAQSAQAKALCNLYATDLMPRRARRFIDKSKHDNKLSLNKDPKKLAKLVPEGLAKACTTLATADVKLFVAYLTNLDKTWKYPVVMTLFTGSARDKSMTEICDRQFRMLGKVVRNWTGDDSVDLFRGTQYSGLGNYLNFSLIVPYFTAMATGIKERLPKNAPSQIRDLEEKDVLEAQFGWNPLESFTLQAPVLEIVPLALYL